MRGLQCRSHLWPTMALLAAVVAFAPAASAQVTVSVDVTGDAVPGGTVTATAVVEITDGSTIESYDWTQVGGVDAVLSGIDTDTVTVALGPAEDYKDYLYHVLAEPPIGPDQLPPNVPPPVGEFPGGLQDRFEVVGVSPFALEHAGMVTLQVEVVTSSGTYHGEGEIHATLGYHPAAGIRTVPVGLPVLLHGKTQDTYDWALSGPGGALDDPEGQNPIFTPDAAGTYTVTVTDVTDPANPAPVTLTIYAGNWQGVITGQDDDGRPVASMACTGCHMDGGIAPDAFTPWAQTGHAEIFTDMLNTNTHYGPGCFACHTVGYNADAVNGGFDDAPDYQAFLDSGLINVPGDNWTTMLADYPATAQLGNIQCENCHGPQGAMAAHGIAGPEGEPRASLSSNVCATCHGEPLRHGRFQQWQLSGHANYELAIEEGTSPSCSRCHSANGFLAWVPAITDDNPDNDTEEVEVTWTEDEVHPQTCQACHDPHNVGTASGDATNAPVRVEGDSPMLLAGFVADNVGKGALCATCHNSRRGPVLRNDGTFSTIYGTSEATRAPHGPTQADLLMGQNMYQVQSPDRSPHANVTNSCVACHMQATPPPPDLSYNSGGANHTFYASNTICSDCHPDTVTADLVQGPVSAALDQIKGLIEDSLLTVMGEQIAGGASIAVGSDTTITSMDTVDSIEFADSRGRQAIIVTFTDTTVVGPVGLNSVNVVPATGDPIPIYNVTPAATVKAGWNWIMAHNDGSLGVHNPDFITTSLENTITAMQAGGPCVPDATTMCLNDDRFKLQLTWNTVQGTSGMGQVVPVGSADSGLFWFFSPDNWEMLVKVLDGCTINDAYWVFFAATTDVEFTLTVTDTDTGSVKTYFNPQQNPANAVTDTAAFATCP